MPRGFHAGSATLVAAERFLEEALAVFESQITGRRDGIGGYTSYALAENFCVAVDLPLVGKRDRRRSDPFAGSNARSGVQERAHSRNAGCLLQGVFQPDIRADARVSASGTRCGTLRAAADGEPRCPSDRSLDSNRFLPDADRLFGDRGRITPHVGRV